MKNLFTLFICFSMVWQSGSSLTVNTTAGGLNLALVGTSILTETDLKITGIMDQRDFKYIQYYLPSITSLDLSDVNIAAYSTYPANTIPITAFTLIPPNNYTKNLQTITLPKSITTIDNQAFYGCTGLTTVIMPSNTLTTIVSGAFYGCTNLTSINISSSVTSIGASSFFGCSKLTSLRIPSSVITIGNAAFSGCTGLMSIYVTNPTPINLSNSLYAFNNVNKTTCILHVPIGAKSAYQAAEVWQNFIIDETTSSAVSNTTKNRTQIYSRLSSIVVDGTRHGEIVDIYSIAGKKLKSFKSMGECITIPMSKNANYIVKTESNTVKVAL